MTELQFLIKLLLDCQLDPDTNQLIADRIREVEAKITIGQVTTSGYLATNTISSRELSRAFVQAPSTQRLLDQNPDLLSAQGRANVYVPNSGPLQSAPQPGLAQALVPIPRGVLDKETGTERIPTGNGTQGPRKWK